MLVLTRKSGQSIQVGEVTITLLKTSGNQVRIGIEAPKEVAVVRTEKAKAA